MTLSVRQKDNGKSNEKKRRNRQPRREKDSRIIHHGRMSRCMPTNIAHFALIRLSRLVPPLQLAPKQPPFGVGTLFCQSQLTAQYLFIMYCKWLGGEARRETHSAWTVLPSTKNWPIIVAQLAYYLNNTDTAPTIHLLPKSKLTTAL